MKIALCHTCIAYQPDNKSPVTELAQYLNG